MKKEGFSLLKVSLMLVANSIKVLESLPYPNIESHVIYTHFEAVDKAKDINELVGVEGDAARIYWKEFVKAIPKKRGFIKIKLIKTYIYFIS